MRIHDERVGALDSNVAIANPGGEHACATVGAIDVEPPVVLRRYVGRGGEVIDDPGICGAARRDDRRYIAQIMIAVECLAKESPLESAVESGHDERIHPGDVQGVANGGVRLIAHDDAHSNLRQAALDALSTGHVAGDDECREVACRTA
ncbi:unannotated protein [freshwater metagenome]|uniref:Unannotated protein n=1 Tax=freshwater metagenome TaxID=449393 RepID=A0A6J7QX06_9ZZZZ